ncbi:DUF6381 family protein [Streptomyces sp. NPDC056452]|uniref:DUF6381 family protein n=1 Tax=Streptomyces sp. NPDC056452 TaxID=3345821 RepID=UPI00369F0B52
MSAADGSAEHIQQMRAKAQEMEEAAKSATDPDERQRLQDKARRLRSRSEQESGMASGDIYPTD